MSDPDLDQLQEMGSALEKFRRAESALAQFSEANPDLMQQLRHLSDSFNDALSNLEKVARAAGKGLGPVKTLRVSTRVDVDRLEKILGRSRLLEIGAEEEVTVKISAEKLRAAKESGQVDPAVADSCMEKSVSFSVPKPKVIP